MQHWRHTLEQTRKIPVQRTNLGDPRRKPAWWSRRRHHEHQVLDDDEQGSSDGHHVLDNDDKGSSDGESPERQRPEQNCWGWGSGSGNFPAATVCITREKKATDTRDCERRRLPSRKETRACDRKTRAKIWPGPLGNCQVENVKPLGMAIFFPLHLQLGVGKKYQNKIVEPLEVL